MAERVLRSGKHERERRFIVPDLQCSRRIVAFVGNTVYQGIWWKNSRLGGVYALVFCIIAVLFEVFQLFEKVPVTFDVCDLILFVSIAFIEGIVYRCFIKRRVL